VRETHGAAEGQKSRKLGRSDAAHGAAELGFRSAPQQRPAEKQSVGLLSPHNGNFGIAGRGMQKFASLEDSRVFCTQQSAGTSCCALAGRS